MTEQEILDQRVSASTIERTLAAAGVVTALAGSAFLWFFNPTNASFFPVCPLYKMTGIACPGCGLTRGFHALFHGDILTALDYNALLPVFAFVLGYFFMSMTLVAARGRGLSVRLFHPAAIWGFLIAALVFVVLRNLPVYPFSIIYP